MCFCLHDLLLSSHDCFLFCYDMDVKQKETVLLAITHIQIMDWYTDERLSLWEYAHANTLFRKST